MESPRAIIRTVDWRFANSVGAAAVATAKDKTANKAERIVMRMFVGFYTLVYLIGGEKTCSSIMRCLCSAALCIFRILFRMHIEELSSVSQSDNLLRCKASGWWLGVTKGKFFGII
jgi:hypothetical protein